MIRLPCLNKPTSRVSRSVAYRLGGAQSLASAIVGKPSPGLARYHLKNADLCSSCKRGQHSGCVSLRCPCLKCNPRFL